MNTQETTEIRELTAAELDAVAGADPCTGYAYADGGNGGGGGGRATLGDLAVAVVGAVVGAVGRWVG